MGASSSWAEGETGRGSVQAYRRMLTAWQHAQGPRTATRMRWQPGMPAKLRLEQPRRCWQQQQQQKQQRLPARCAQPPSARCAPAAALPGSTPACSSPLCASAQAKRGGRRARGHKDKAAAWGMYWMCKPCSHLWQPMVLYALPQQRCRLPCRAPGCPRGRSGWRTGSAGRAPCAQKRAEHATRLSMHA